MLIALILIFVALPALEIYLFILVGGLIGPLATIGLVFLAAVLGGAIIRAQAPRAIGRAQDSLRRGEAPVREVLDGLALFAAGFLLILPGFFSDLVGLLLLIPWVRTTLGFAILAQGLARATPRKPAGIGVIDGEFEVVEGTAKPGPSSAPPRIPPSPEAG